MEGPARKEKIVIAIGTKLGIVVRIILPDVEMIEISQENARIVLNLNHLVMRKRRIRKRENLVLNIIVVFVLEPKSVRLRLAAILIIRKNLIRTRGVVEMIFLMLMIRGLERKREKVINCLVGRAEEARLGISRLFTVLFAILARLIRLLIVSQHLLVVTKIVDHHQDRHQIQKVMNARFSHKFWFSYLKF